MKRRIVEGLLLAACMLAGSATASSSRLPNPFLSPGLEVAKQPLLSSILDVDQSLTNCRPTGQIDDARCDYETVERDINKSNFFQLLGDLVQEKYFRFYKVDLYKDCPFWNENSLCMSRDCTVSKVDESQIPIAYREACLSSLKTTEEADVLYQPIPSSPPHDHSTHNTPADGSSLGVNPDTCQCAETDFCHWEDEEWSPESKWVDLIDNPERFTGYSGPGAQKVWRSIYEENCFGMARPSSQSASSGMLGGGASLDAAMRDSKLAAEAFSSLLSKQSNNIVDTEQCLEKRVFYKIISGLHASISIHICHDYLDQMTGEWRPNLACFVERIAQHPERLQNVYFNHVVLTRALAKLAERLGMTQTGKGKVDRRVLTDDQVLARLAPGLPSSPSNGSLGRLLQQSLDTPPTFDEASMFEKSNPESEFLRREFRDRFRNVSRIMDCVGCDKCRLWGKLQVNGLGTALKILFEGSNLKEDRLLQRSELVALINTVHRTSESIRAVETFRDLYEEEAARKSAQQQGAADTAQEVEKKRENSNRTSAQSSPPSSSSSSKQQQPSSPSSLRESLLQKAKKAVDRGRTACESQWEKCLSWWLTLFDSDSRSKAKTEL